MTTFDLVTSITFGSSILYAFIAVLTLRRRDARQRTKKAASALGIYALISFLWAAEQAAWRLGWLSFLMESVLARLPLYGVFLLSASLLFLTRAFFQRKGSGWGWWLFGVVWMTGLVVLDANPFAFPDVLWTGNGWYLPRDVAAAGMLVSGWVVYWSGAAIITWKASRQADLPVYRNAILYWALLLALTALGDALFFLGYRALGGTIHLVSAFLAAYVVMTIRLPDLRRTVRQSFRFLILTSLSVALYTAAYWGVHFVFQSVPADPSTQPLLVGLTFAVALVFLLNPFLVQSGKLVERLIPGGDKDPARVLHRYSQSITNVLDLQLLATLAVSTVSEMLDIRRGFLFLVDFEKGTEREKGYHLRGVKGMGEQNPEPGLLPEESPLAEYLCHEHRPVTQYDIDRLSRFKEISEAERTWLEGLRTDVYIPIYSKDEWIGLLALGPQFSGPTYRDESLDWLNMLANQTAVAMENVRLVEGLMRLNNEFRRAYAALDQANQRLEQLDRTKSDFISVASHELRTPLTVISGSAQILLEEPALQENPYYKKLISKIQTGTIRLHEVLDSMLIMAKIDARDLQLEPEPVSIRALVEVVTGDLQSAFEEREQTLEIKGLNDLPAVEVDHDALQKVFFHLISNAIKYTPDGGKITVSGHKVEHGANELSDGGVEIIVSDTGVGIDPQFQELIFVKFYQTGELALHSSGKTKFKGNGPGLGLAIAQGIVQAHGGKVWVESPGYDDKACPGSRFHVLLPSKQPSGEEVQLAEPVS